MLFLASDAYLAAHAAFAAMVHRLVVPWMLDLTRESVTSP